MESWKNTLWGEKFKRNFKDTKFKTIKNKKDLSRSSKLIFSFADEKKQNPQNLCLKIAQEQIIIPVFWLPLCFF